MAEYRLRIKQKADTSGNWSLHGDFVPLKGEICIYTDAVSKQVDDGNGNMLTIYEPRIKIGDGVTPISQIPYVTQDLEERLQEHIDDAVRHITQIERIKWNSKLDSEVESTTLNLYNEYST